MKQILMLLSLIPPFPLNNSPAHFMNEPLEVISVAGCMYPLKVWLEKKLR